MESDATSAARNFLWGQVMVFGLASLAMVALVFFAPVRDFGLWVFVVFATALCLLGFAAGLVTLFRTPSSESVPEERGAFPCRHCGRLLPSPRALAAHERVCSEMRL